MVTPYKDGSSYIDTGLVPFSDPQSWVVIDQNTAAPDVTGKIPKPGLYILVAQYKHDNPGLNHSIERRYRIIQCKR